MKREFAKALTLRLDSTAATEADLIHRLNFQLDTFPASFRPKPMKLGLHFLTVGLEAAELATGCPPRTATPHNVAKKAKVGK